MGGHPPRVPGTAGAVGRPGPFVAEACTADGDTEHSPVGDHLYCENKTWTVIAW